MARPRQRVCLQDGLYLDLNKLLREGLGPPGKVPWPVDICLSRYLDILAAADIEGKEAPEMPECEDMSTNEKLEFLKRELGRVKSSLRWKDNSGLSFASWTVA
jgi:hypothetical protein